jgi:hypothetical protein
MYSSSSVTDPNLVLPDMQIKYPLRTNISLLDWAYPTPTGGVTTQYWQEATLLIDFHRLILYHLLASYLPSFLLIHPL